jgi:hypothetical protein
MPTTQKPSVDGLGGFAWCVSLDGEIDRDKQQGDRGEIADIDAMRFGEREQHAALGERLHDHQPDGHGGKHKRLEPAPAAGLHGPRHLPHGSGSCVRGVLGTTHWSSTETTRHQLAVRQARLACRVVALPGSSATVRVACTVCRAEK